MTTVIYTGDPLSPATITKEATAQNYSPEWILGPNVLADTAIFGRTFDQDQWKNAFGVSLIPARGADETQEALKLYRWFTGEEPPSNTRGVINPSIHLLFRGLHLAGPKLTPKAFRDGQFRYPVTGEGAVAIQTSYGDHGIWPFTDYSGSDTAAIIWWDPEAQGQDEVGQEGSGLYRYANEGQRYSVGEFPSETESGLHDDASSVTIFETLPPADTYPDYPAPRPASRYPPVSAAASIARPLAVDVAADDARRVPDRDRVVRQVARHDRSRAHDDVPADRDAGDHDGAVAEPRRVPDAHRAGRRELPADRDVHVLVAVVGVGDVHVVAGPHVVAEHDRLVADDARALPDQAAIADLHHGMVADVERRHPRRQRHVGPEQAPGTDVDRTLAEQRRHREADHGVVAERAEPARPAAARPDRSHPLGALPRLLEDVAGEVAQSLEHGVRPARSRRPCRPDRASPSRTSAGSTR